MKIHNLTRHGKQWTFTTGATIYYTDKHGNGLYYDHSATGKCETLTHDFKASRCRLITLLKLTRIFR